MLKSPIVGTAQDALIYLEDQAAGLPPLFPEFDASKIVNVVLQDWRFPIWSGSSKPHQHHYGQGGLVIHTAEVVKLCLENNKLFDNQINQTILFLAALFHDVGKMWDYEPVRSSLTDNCVEFNEYLDWKGTSHKRHIHHISRSALVWQSAAKEKYMSDGQIDEVLHAILAHHGQREWGSPVSPNTKLAWMLHLCDGISARMDDAERWDRHQ